MTKHQSFAAPSPSGSLPDEAEAFLARHPEVEAVDVVLIDLNGVGRGKIIRRHELMPLFEGGRHFPISVLALDITGEDVHETGLTWAEGDRDLRAWPVPGTLAALHGTRRAQVLVTLFDLDGGPIRPDPRQALARQAAQLRAKGLHPAAAFELEFFLLDAGAATLDKFAPAASLTDGRRSPKTEVYSVDHLHGMEPLFADIYAAAEAQSVPVETIISEFAPGQFELTLRYRDDVLRAADDLVMLKRLVRAQARRHGLVACFMAKPVEGHAGSGMHFHVSLCDGEGGNLFRETEGERFAPRLLHALGGLAATMPESMLVFAPHANSWRRFVSNAYAPVAPTWGINNRSVALRVPAGPVSSRRIEHRPAGVDANPYLVASVILAGIDKGLEERLDPGPEITGDGYAKTSEATLPRDWREAIERAAASAFLTDALSPELHNVFLAIKRSEHAMVSRTVTELDYRLYLHEV